LYDFTQQFAALTVPTLIVVGDEDDPCLEVSIFLKRTIPTAGLFIQPRTGHAINLEEPAAFNREVQEFFSTVERGRWERRDPRAAVSVPLQR
jgi:pimeloyl-ACP methyl ester carboxylesterase